MSESKGDKAWKEARRQQHAEFYALTFREKLERIEQMAEMVAVMQAGRPTSTAESPTQPIKKEPE